MSIRPIDGQSPRVEHGPPDPKKSVSTASVVGTIDPGKVFSQQKSAQQEQAPLQGRASQAPPSNKGAKRANEAVVKNPGALSQSRDGTLLRQNTQEGPK